MDYKTLFSSPNTTWAGILTFVTLLATQLGFLFDADPSTNVDVPVIIMAFWSLITGILSRDNNVSSEQAGAKEEIKES